MFKKTKIGLGCDPHSFFVKQKNEIGLGGDPNSNSHFQTKQNEIGLGGDRNSNLNFQKKTRNRHWRWPKFECKCSTQNGLVCDPNSNLNAQTTKIGLGAIQIRILNIKKSKCQTCIVWANFRIIRYTKTNQHFKIQNPQKNTHFKINKNNFNNSSGSRFKISKFRNFKIQSRKNNYIQTKHTKLQMFSISF